MLAPSPFKDRNNYIGNENSYDVNVTSQLSIKNIILDSYIIYVVNVE